MKRRHKIQAMVNAKELLLVREEATREGKSVSDLIWGLIVSPLVKRDFERLLKKAKQREKVSPDGKYHPNS